jgi:hypothetical protein
MTPLINRRVRITSITIAVLTIAALLSAPVSVLSLVAGGDDNPLVVAPPAFQPAPLGTRHAATHDAMPGRIDPVDEHLETGSASVRESVDHHVEELLGDGLLDDPSIELTQGPGSLDDGGPLDGFDFPQHGHLPLVAANNEASGFPRSGGRFRGAGGWGAAGGGSGAAGGGSAVSSGGSAVSGGDSGAANGDLAEEASNDGGSARDPESIDSPSVDRSGDSSEDRPGNSSEGRSGNSEVGRGMTPGASQPGTPGGGPPRIESLPKIEDGKVDVDAGPKNPQVPSPGGDGSGPETPSIAGPGNPVTPVSVPEPSSFLLMGLGLAALVARHRRASRRVLGADEA